MLSFGDFKNNIQKLKKYMTKMNIFEELSIPKTSIDQKQLRNKNTQFYLQIIHYAITAFNTQLYARILDIVPNIKTLSDQKFAQSVLNISRKLLNMDPAITADQLLSNKYAEKKVQFIADLCMNVYEWNSNKKQQNKEIKNNQTKGYSYEPPKIEDENKQPNLINFEDQQDELEQREITVQPTKFDVQIINPSFGTVNSFVKNRNEIIRSEDSGKISKQTVSFRSKPNVFPKMIGNQYLQEITPNEQNQFVSTSKIEKPLLSTKPPNLVYQSISQKDDSVQYVTKQQFNQVLQMMAKMNNTLNDLAAKFTNFQSTVTYWVNNTNAKISILQQNVKMIKANL